MDTRTSNSSRSSSPTTPDSLSDGLGSDNATQNDVDLAAWCHTSPEPDSIQWGSTRSHSMDGKVAHDNVLMLEDIMQQNAYQSNPPVYAVDPAVFQMSQPMMFDDAELDLFSTQTSGIGSDCDGVEAALHTWPPAQSPTSAATHPQQTQTRKLDNQSPQMRVIYPPKESCYNLAILTPTIPSCGTKSRVETQIRVQLDLVHIANPSDDTLSHDRVGSWKWLQLPRGTSTRKRARKEGKIDADPVDTLYLAATVVCSSSPQTKVISCSTCRGREAKRVARKIAARIRPVRSESEANEDPNLKDTNEQGNILQFNCSDILDFSSGSVVLPLRITCYCRHHREKVGFNVQFTMVDSSGRVVGTGVSPPIMITDDHKSTGVGKSQTMGPLGSEECWEIGSAACGTRSSNGSRKRQAGGKEVSGQIKKRQKPYDTRRTSACAPNEDQSFNYMFAGNSLSVDHFDPLSAEVSACSSTAPPSPKNEGDPASLFPSPPPSYASPTAYTSPTTTTYMEHDMAIFEAGFSSISSLPISPPRTAPPSPPINRSVPLTMSSMASPQSDLPLNTLFNMQPEYAFNIPVRPRIHRVIPSSGPTYGGVEVTVLGSDFHPSLSFNCVFGDVVASSTSRWSDNTLVCILPPRQCAGMVAVTLEGIKMDDGNEYASPLFTYVDESPRALMELALQVVGLKMTGKMEDAKSIAIRIVGSSAQEDSTLVGSSTVMSRNPSYATTEFRRILLSQGGPGDDFEKLILDFLRIIDVQTDDVDDPALISSSLSHPMSNGQTLLHLSTFLNFPRLTQFLVDHRVELEAQDQNGFTALHLAAVVRSDACAQILCHAGASVQAKDLLGRAAGLLAPGFFESLETIVLADDDDESQWADLDESTIEHTRSKPAKHVLSRRSRFTPGQPRRRRRRIVSNTKDCSIRDNHDEEVDEDDAATVVGQDSPAETESPVVDEKTAATFAALLQRAWSQFQTPQFIPQMPQIPQIPHLRDVPAWVFPVFVPMPAWPTFLGEKSGRLNAQDTAKPDVSGSNVRDGTPESRISWEKWVAQMSAVMATMQRTNPDPQQDDKGLKGGASDTTDIAALPSVVDEPRLEVTLTPAPTRSILRRFGSSSVPVTDQEVNAYTYRPKRSNKLLKKEDRMLILFWIPILILAIGWATYTVLPYAYSQLQSFLPMNNQLSHSLP